jgi:hypothetical protein
MAKLSSSVCLNWAKDSRGYCFLLGPSFHPTPRLRTYRLAASSCCVVPPFPPLHCTTGTIGVAVCRYKYRMANSAGTWYLLQGATLVFLSSRYWIGSHRRVGGVLKLAKVLVGSVIIDAILSTAKV